MRALAALAVAGTGTLALVALTACTEPLPNGSVVAVDVTVRGHGPNPSRATLCVSPDFLADAQSRKGAAETAQWQWSGSTVCAAAQSDDLGDRPVRWRAIEDCQVGETYVSGDTCQNKMRL